MDSFLSRLADLGGRGDVMVRSCKRCRAYHVLCNGAHRNRLLSFCRSMPISTQVFLPKSGLPDFGGPSCIECGSDMEDLGSVLRASILYGQERAEQPR